MKKKWSTFLGTAAVVATLSLPALAASSQIRSGEAISVDGLIQRVKVDARQGSQKKALAVVTMSGQVYLLRPDSNAPKAFQTASRAADRDDWFKVSGTVSKKDGALALEVQNIRKT